MCHKAVYDAGCTDANGNEDYSNLFKGDNRGELLTTLIHEMKHHCQFDNGQTCFEDLPYPPLVKQQLNDFCLELSIDLTIYADLCALVQTKCTALCDLLSQPIQAGSPEALEAWRLRSEILGLCRSMELLRARYNTNEWASRLCKCRNGVYTGDGVQYPPDSQACSTIMPPYPAGGTPPPDCEYTNDPQLLPECNNCPCVCTQSTWFNNGEPALY
jgi:hypothetical protein